MNIKIKIGSSMLEFEGRDLKEVAKEAAAFGQGNKCGCCKSSNVAMDYRSAKAKSGEKAGQAFDYFSIKCMDCYARAQLGQYQAGGWFLKKWEKWEAPQQQQQKPATPGSIEFEPAPEGF